MDRPEATEGSLMGGLGKAARAMFPVSSIANSGVKGGKNKPPPNYLGEASQQATGAVMPGLTSAMQQGVNYDPSQDINRAIEANWQQSTSRLDPMWQQRQQHFGSQMANQGLDPGMAAYDASAGTLNRAQTDAYQTALRGAIGQGNETARTAFAAKMLPFNQYGALMGGGAPGAQQATDVYNAQQMQQTGKKNSLASMAPYAMLAL